MEKLSNSFVQIMCTKKKQFYSKELLSKLSKHSHLICFFAFLVLYPYYISAQQWISYSPTAGFDINTIDVLKPGYIVTGGGKESSPAIQIMFSSPDYGVTWFENPHDGFAEWNKSVAFADTVNGYGVGDSGRIISTNDGGLNWGFAVFPTSRNLNKVVNVTPYLYYAVGGNKSNGSMQTILKTTNFGTSWNVIYDNPGPWLKSVYFINTSKGFAVGDSGVILSTNNGGSSWSTIPAPVQRDFNAITFINADTGFIAGGDQTHRTIIRTDDGGANWFLVADTTGRALNDISFADNTTGYIVGDSAMVIKTTDGGTTWATQIISNTLTGNEEFRTVKFYDKNFGALAGKGGVLYLYFGYPLDLFGLGADVIDSTNADIYAGINTHGFPAAINFVYSTDSTFATSLSTPVQGLRNDTLFPFHTHLSNLAPNTWYYYFAQSGNKAGDTLRFYTGSAYPVFKTIAGDVIDSSTLRLRGTIHGYASVTNIQFEYGTTPFLGNIIAASPGSVNDTADYAVTALLNSVQPFTLIYYRLRGETAGDTVYGDIYFAGNPFHVLQTLPANNISDTSVVLNGLEQGFPGQVKLSFEYGLAQGPTSETFPYLYSQSDSFHFVSNYITGLLPGQFYYYRLKAESGIGTRYGKLLISFTGKEDSIIQTLPAQSVTAVSARLEGIINHFPEGAALSFVYSTDSSFTNSIIASPSTINDTLFHKVTALLTGVPINNLYYYRLKAVTAGGAEIYGNIRSVFIGDNEIPNWDFQNWTQHTYSVPAGWNIATKDFNRVPGHSGNYALNLTGVNLAILGFPSEDKNQGGGLKFLGGMPFTGRPDSLSFYVKGSLVQGDSSVVILYLHQGSTKIAKNLFKIAVNTGGVFQRVSLPITYDSPLMPDSLILGISSVNPDYPTPGNQNNNITVDDFTFISTTAPVYNGNFETWFDYNTDLPDNWYSPVFLGLDSTNPSFSPSVYKTMFSTPYDYAAGLQTNDLGNLGLFGGNLGLKLYAFYGDAVPAFAVNTKHHTLNGFYQAYPANGDTMQIEVNMYYQGESVGSGKLLVIDSVTQFTPFEITIGYLGEGYDSVIHAPDSADIEMISYSVETLKPRGLSRLIVDKLHFDGFVNGIDDEYYHPSHFDENGLKIYPNPSKNLMTIELLESLSHESSVQVYNLNGQLQMEMKMPTGENKTSFSVADMEPGFYLLRWVNGTKVANKKIVVVK